MKEIMRVETNAGSMFLTYDPEEQIVRVYDIVDDISIDDVEDDSSWEAFEGVEDVEVWLGTDYNNPDAARIVECQECLF